MNKNNKVTKIVVSSSHSSKKNLIDGKKDTCWISSHTPEQYVELFILEVYIDSLEMTFQPGFQPKRGNVTFCGATLSFEIHAQESSKIVVIKKPLNYLKISFIGSHDIYQRICIYSINIF